MAAYGRGCDGFPLVRKDDRRRRRRRRRFLRCRQTQGTYLRLHDRLLEPRARHCFCPDLLTRRPGRRPVGCLGRHDLARFLGRFYDRLVRKAMGVNRRRIRLECGMGLSGAYSRRRGG